MLNEVAYCTICKRMVSTTVGGECVECGNLIDEAWEPDDFKE
jgi:hypothetical protein